MFNTTMKTKIQIVMMSVVLLACSSLSLSLGRVSSVGAATCDPEKTVCRDNSVSDDCSQDNLDKSNCGIVKLLDTAFNLVSGAISLVIIGNIIYAGIQYSMAQGDPSKASKSKDRIRNAVIAFIMYLSLYAFIQWLIPGGVFK